MQILTITMHVFLKQISIQKVEKTFIPFITFSELGTSQICYFAVWADFSKLSNSEASDISFTDLQTPRKRKQSCSQSHHLSGVK